jgi:hypothetical protein
MADCWTGKLWYHAETLGLFVDIMGMSLLVICFFEFHLSMLPSRMLFTVYNSS